MKSLMEKLALHNHK